MNLLTATGKLTERRQVQRNNWFSYSPDKPIPSHLYLFPALCFCSFKEGNGIECLRNPHWMTAGRN